MCGDASLRRERSIETLSFFVFVDLKLYINEDLASRVPHSYDEAYQQWLGF